MENRINVAELLKNCPKGMEVDCTAYNDVTFLHVDESQNRCYFKAGPSDTFWTTCYGHLNYSPNAKCAIFPKGETNWEGFVPPCKFKDGDVIYMQEIKAFAIYNKQTDDATFSHCFLNILGEFKIWHRHRKELSGWRLATEKEKQILFQAIKLNGYHWNEKKKILEKLVTEKFDINTLVPFASRVLVRDSKNENWRPAVWGFCDESVCSYPFEVVGGQGYTFCIPYEGNEHLLGTTEDCEDRYKLWLS